MTLGHQTEVTQRKTTQAKATLEQAVPEANNLSAPIDHVPVVKPPFSVADVRRAIPAHCFQRSLVKSCAYLALDLAIVAVMMFLSRYIDTTLTDDRFGKFGGFLLRSAAWCVYWVITGNVMTGLWVIGHECGHGAFSDWEAVSDCFGVVIHSFLLVPYFSWKVSHRRHHSATGNIERDEVFVPPVAPASMKHEEAPMGGAIIHDTIMGLKRAFHITLMLTIGWPLYLSINATGNSSYPKNRWVNHFLPTSPIFETTKEKIQVLLSDIALVAVFVVLYNVASVIGFAYFAKVYIVPYMITNLFLVLITFLQHTDPVLPHYTNTEWHWLRGALATVDRNYGLLNYFHHHIADTHVVHHLFSMMPHYHAEEATEAVKPLLGAYYRFDNTPITKALWNNFHNCECVAPDAANKNVLWFKPLDK